MSEVRNDASDPLLQPVFLKAIWCQLPYRLIKAIGQRRRLL